MASSPSPLSRSTLVISPVEILTICSSSIPAGWIADRTSSRRLPFLCGLAALLGATVLLGFGNSIAVLVVARILQGISAAVVWTVGLAMVLDTVGPENLGKTIGTVSFMLLLLLLLTLFISFVL